MLFRADLAGDPKVFLALAGPFFCIWLLYILFPWKRSPCPLPPGPPGKFLIGNVGQLSDQPEQDYIRWGKEYKSDVIHLNVLGQHVICLNSVKAATDLLDRRGANYCDRPRFTLFEVYVEIPLERHNSSSNREMNKVLIIMGSMGWGLTLTFLRWGPQFKLHRRLFQTTFTRSAIKTFEPIQTQEARRAVRSLLRAPDDWRDTTLLFTTSVIFRIAYGQAIRSKASPYTAMARAANDATTSGGVAGSSVVDAFPLARWLLPSRLSPALRHARRSRAAIQTIHEVPWADNLRDIEAGTATPSFMRTHLARWADAARSGAPHEATLADLKGATAAVFIAGGNSTWGTIMAAMLFLTKHPEAQARVRAEIDAVVGPGRLPGFADRPLLRRLEHFMNEAMRVLPLNPLVIPHRSLRDDAYEGMFVPAGTVVFANTKAMSSNPATYRDPERFDPDRYDRGEPYPVGNFGFGRRRCPGSHLALASVYLFLATLLAVFELEKVVDDEGRVVEPEAALRVGLGGHPMPFECRLRLRSPERAQVLLDEDEDEAGL